MSYAGRNISHMRPYEVARIGVRRTFQHPRLCWEWTLLENVMIAAPSARRGLSIRDRSLAVLEELGIGDLADERASNTDGVTQLRTQIARCLVADPRILALDEPSAGMDDMQSAALAHLLRTVAGAGVAVILIAHDLTLIRSAAAVVTVLSSGELIADGPTAQVLALPEVRAAYMGAAVQ